MTRTATRRSDRHRNEGGLVLVWFALIVFALFGLLSVIADVGMARLTQRQMQAAVDAAAVEGLRPSTPPFDAEPRNRVRKQVAWTFDDDFDTAADAMQFGAGPVVEFSGGVGSLNALQTIEGGSVYDPVLQSNPDNIQHGDMIAGAFDPQASATEFADYSREDFTPADPGETDEAFLVRMRRSHDPLGLDDVPGVSSGGPSIPLLFGRGALISGADPATGYSPRHHGLTVRATAIADVADRGHGSTRLKSAGPSLDAADPGGPRIGRTPWTINLDAWSALTPSSPVTVEVATDGSILQASSLIGRFAQGTDTIAAVVTPTPPSIGVESGFVPLTLSFAGGTRVVGYGWATLTPITGSGQDLRLLTRLPSLVARDNGTASVDERVARRLSSLHQQSPNDFSQLMTRHRTFPGATRAPILAR